MRPFALALFCAAVASAQGFANLATNRDGSLLYFVSPARMKDTAQYFTPKVFRWDSKAGIALVEQRAADEMSPPPHYDDSFVLGADYYLLFAPFVSSDGSVVAFSGSRYCWACAADYAWVYQATVREPGKPDATATGAATLSPNGRYMTLSGPGPKNLRQRFPFTVLDRETGVTTEHITGPTSLDIVGPHRVADNGAVLLATPDGLAIGRPDGTRVIPGTAGVESSLWHQYAMISAAGDRVLFERPGALSLYSVATGATVDVLTGRPIQPSEWMVRQFPAAISDDASAIAVILGDDRQVYVVGGDGKGLRQLGAVRSGAAEIIMSGDGAVVFAVTRDNAIVRIDVGSGAVVEIVPATPLSPERGRAPSRGVLSNLVALGLATEPFDASAPYPLSLGGVEVRLEGVPVPLAHVGSDGAWYVVPWDIPARPFELELRSAASASPFVAGTLCRPPVPQPFIWNMQGYPTPMQKAVHEDFTWLVLPYSPAEPGEVIHAYAHDLGRVAPTPPYGATVPLTPLFRLAPAISCSLASAPLDVLYAGLAPGQPNGVFQVDVRIPSPAPDGPGWFSCAIDGVGTFGGYLYTTHRVSSMRSSLTRR